MSCRLHSHGELRLENYVLPRKSGDAITAVADTGRSAAARLSAVPSEPAFADIPLGDRRSRSFAVVLTTGVHWDERLHWNAANW
jgi:hypothetical protein